MATTMQPAAGETTKQLVNYRTDGGVAVIEMCDPPANTYTYEMNRQLDEAILRARMDNDVYVILLTGAGDKFFSAGANIKMLSSVDPTFKYYFCLHANEMLLRLEHTPKLVIAAINGHCVGGGLEIAMAADIRIARKDAGKIGLPEVNLGVLPGTGGTQRLSRMVGKSKAIELMVTGNTFSFEEAQELGIINDIFERDGFMENIMEYAKQFCPPNKACQGRGTHQARRADGMGDSDGVRAGGGARESANAVPERRRERRPGCLCGEAAGGFQSEIAEHAISS
jgi:enoyl-CoA hydratase